jgi:hypothetical protein
MNWALDGYNTTDTTRVYPEVLQAVAAGLFSTEPDLVITILALSSTVYQVSKVDLLCIRSPCVRENSVLGNVVAEVLGQDELAIVVTF